MRAKAIALLAILTGCAWDAGEPFATLTPHLDARLDTPSSRDVGMGWQGLASSYHVRIDTLELDTIEVELVGGASGTLRFDPANPPPGYSLCHNGHCHAADGSLVDYEDIEAELAQGGSGASAVMILPTGALDLIAGESRPLDCVPSCELPLGTIGLVSLDVTRVTLGGLVRDGRASPRIDGELPWLAELSFSGDQALVLATAIELPADRGHDPDVALTIELALTSALLDDVAWADLTAGPIGATQDGYDLASDAGARDALNEALNQLDLEVIVTR